MIDAMERLDVRLLGRFEVSVDDQPVPNAAWTHARARDLVKLLALAPGHRMPRDRVLEELRPQLGVDAAVAKLHKAERDTCTFNFHGTHRSCSRTYYGPTMNAYEATPANGREAELHDELDTLFNGQNASSSDDLTSIPVAEGRRGGLPAH